MSSPPSLLQLLETYWGYKQFRPMQEEIIRSVLAGNDTLALLPTGGGKSICYQLPAMAMDGLCLVISPLIALMKDQVEALRRKNITAFALHTGLTRKEVINVLRTAGHSNCKFLYVSPERLETELFKEYLPSLPVNLIAVDEAHCISQWGYDFRPSYLKIAQLREELPHIPVLAVTATATPEVQADICKQLHFRGQHIFKSTFRRSNLSFSVLNVPAKMQKVLHILQKVPGSAVIYCKSRRLTQEVAQQLLLHGVSADYYHAGLGIEVRNEKQQQWLKGYTRVMVCTNAFGMGIDKPDVRCVIHHDIPECLENYYQEAGRAGRDGNKAYAVLLYEDKDLHELANASSLRFPDAEVVKNVYRCLVNYLQIPAGTGKGIWYRFDINDFIKTFRLHVHTAVYSIKMLEQQGWLIYAPQIFLPSRLVFTCAMETLRNAEQELPALDPLIKALLRNYGGIFDIEQIISEKQLAAFLQTNVERVKEGLLQLQHRGMVAYTPQSDEARLQFLHNRPRTEDLHLNPQLQTLLKSQYEKRLSSMLHYLQQTQTCRAVLLESYFGETTAKACGICDVCLQRFHNPPGAEEIEAVYRYIERKMSANGIPLQLITQNLSTRSKHKLLRIIDVLVGEERITVTPDGMIELA